MAVRTKGKKKTEQCVMATPAEWARFCNAAKNAGMTQSEFFLHIFHAWEATATATRHGLHPTVLLRMAEAVLTLEGIERQRLDDQGASDIWRKEAAEARAWIDREEARR